MNEPRRGSCKLCQGPNVVYTSINIRKIKFIAYIYIHFNQNVDEKSDISAKIEAGKHLNASLTSLTSNQLVETHSLFWRHLKSCDVAWLIVIIGT